MHFFLLVPSDSPSGPVKGAFAIANELVKRDLASINLIFLKSGPGSNQPLDPRVITHCLHMERTGLIKALRQYKALINRPDSQKVVSLSMCFSADIINFFMCGVASAYTSIRGNLFANYERDYGPIGIPLALFHLLICRRFKSVFVLSGSMKQQVAKFVSVEPVILRNFIDEAPLEPYRKEVKLRKCFRIGFLGSLSKRKRPLLLVDLLVGLTSQGYDVYLDVVGSGPLMRDFEAYAKQSGQLRRCTLHGFLKNPFNVLNDVDVLVLPSESEGTSRAVMEALFLGIPCVGFDVDGMSELITNGENGVLVKSEEQLLSAVLRARELSIGYVEATKPCLLPHLFRQEIVVDSMLEQIYEY